jgi:hypothetical protein
MGARCDSLNVESGAGRLARDQDQRKVRFQRWASRLGYTVQACSWKVDKERRAASRGAGRYRKRIDQERYWSWEGGDSGEPETRNSKEWTGRA